MESVKTQDRDISAWRTACARQYWITAQIAQPKNFNRYTVLSASAACLRGSGNPLISAYVSQSQHGSGQIDGQGIGRTLIQSFALLPKVWLC